MIPKFSSVLTIGAALAFGIASSALGMPVKSQTIKKQVSMVDAENRPLQSLDLKAKIIAPGKTEIELCGTSLVRKAQTLTYSCTIAIPLKAKVTRFQNLTSPKTLETTYAGGLRTVSVEVSDDAKAVTFTTSFDSTGVDFEISKFNDDFFNLYAQAAHMVISDALKKQAIKMEVLESRH